MIDIEKINKRHFLETDMYYRVEMGLSSRLIKYNNGVFHLEVVIGRNGKKKLQRSSSEMAYCWKQTNEELTGAIACKVYIIDTNKNPYKHLLLNSDVEVEYDARKGILFYRQHLN
ncbi:MAG: hypothetical protein IPJ54_03625 [Saprospiraceae bacterium]|nr:hypothetical protein [Saprospiraceae bacterium]